MNSIADDLVLKRWIILLSTCTFEQFQWTISETDI